MKELLFELFWCGQDIQRVIFQYLQTIPEYREAHRDFNQISGQVKDILGAELYGQFEEKLAIYTEYEMFAHYAFGLGLRRELIQSLDLS